MSDISIDYCGIKFTNPFILPSGIITEVKDHVRAIDAGVGGVTLKSLTYEKREGNPLPRMWKYDHGMINSVGLRNAGIEKGSQEIAEFLYAHRETPTIVSLFATKVKEFLYLVEKVVPLKPTFIELNLSCPNVETEFGEPLGMELGAASQIVREVKKISGAVPVLAKLSPNVPNIVDIAKACEQTGASGIVAINSVGPGMLIDIKNKRPYLGAKKGGLTGPAILPIAVRCIYEIYEAVDIPILGMGGVTTASDVVQLMMAGAKLVGVGTATYTKGMKVYGELCKELSDWMEKEGVKNLTEIIGVAHH